MSQSSNVVEPLRAHARLWRQIALESACEETRAELEQMASECDRAAVQMTLAKADITLH